MSVYFSICVEWFSVGRVYYGVVVPSGVLFDLAYGGRVSRVVGVVSGFYRSFIGSVVTVYVSM